MWELTLLTTKSELKKFEYRYNCLNNLDVFSIASQIPTRLICQKMSNKPEKLHKKPLKLLCWTALFVTSNRTLLELQQKDKALFRFLAQRRASIISRAIRSSVYVRCVYPVVPANRMLDHKRKKQKNQCLV